MWISLLEASNECYPWSPLLLERPLRLYTSQELEDIVLRRESAEILRHNESLYSPCRTSIIPIADEFKLSNIHLIDGGRWLLIFSGTGAVSYSDLNTPVPIVKSLIPEQLAWLTDTDHIYEMKTSVCIDHESPVLTFNLATFTSRHGSDSIRIQVVRVWRICLVLGDNGDEEKLSANLLASFDREDYGRLYSFDLLGNYIAFGAESAIATYHPCYVSVVNWVEASSHQQQHTQDSGIALEYPRIIMFLSQTPTELRLMPGKRILIAYESYIGLYDLASLEVTTYVPPVNFRTNIHSQYSVPIWSSRELSCYGYGSSRVYICRRTNMARITVVGQKSVHGIVFPADIPESEPTVVKLASFRVDHGTACASGYNCTLIHNGASQLQMFHCSWFDDKTMHPANSLNFKFDTGAFHRSVLASDEGSGRIALNKRHHVFVYHFAKN